MQSNNNNNSMNTDENDFNVVSKKGKKVIVAAIVKPVSKPIILCDHCQRPGHKIEKCFLLSNLEKLKTTECVYCHGLGHDNKNCPVSKSNAERKRIKAEVRQQKMDQAEKLQMQKDVKYATDFPSMLSTETIVVPEQLKFAWASVAMANINPTQLKKMDEENAIYKEIFKKQDHIRRVKDNLEKKLEKKEADKQHWYKIKPVVLAMKEAYPTSWIYELENTPYDTDQASNLRFEDQRKKDLEEEKYRLDAIERHIARLLMTEKELEEDNRQIEENYEDVAADEQNADLSLIFRSSQYDNFRPKIICCSCDMALDAGNQGSRCVSCIFELGDI